MFSRKTTFTILVAGAGVVALVLIGREVQGRRRRPISKKVKGMRTVLVTGASRGLGLEFCRQLALSPHPYRVLAASRNGKLAPALKQLNLEHVEPLQLDVTSQRSVDRLQRYLEAEKICLHLLINNAGVALARTAKMDTVNFADWEQTFAINVLGCARVVKACLPSLMRHQSLFVIANISSKLGSMKCTLDPTVAFNVLSTDITYRTSKAALNMMTACMHLELRGTCPDHGCIVAIDPSWVNTDMGSRNGTVKPPLEPPEVVAGVLEQLRLVTPMSSGQFIRYDGAVTPW
eukprot:gb/GEZN01008627.1/.p1 GENE.gb/GEZN01008627.1/~~gb/GEZN01008627.1/.p1  ORF type:complete len:290 (+),score=19.22 gb/GEZN01008627.1/:111-980(+)